MASVQTPEPPNPYGSVMLNYASIQLVSLCSLSVSVDRDFSSIDTA